MTFASGHRTDRRWKQCCCTVLVMVASLLMLARGDLVPYEFSDIDSYTVEKILSSELADLSDDHWAVYNDSACTQVLSISNAATGQSTFESVNFTTSFFSTKNVSWYASPSGFLTTASRAMCPFFCNQENLKNESGNYQFSDSFGGDWPMAALFTADLTVATVAGATVLSNSRVDPDVRIVQYTNIPFQDNTSGTTLNAQVVLYANSTIVFRYKSVPEVTSVPIFGNASTGLIFSAKSRVVVETPTAENGIVAYRFTPQLANCSGYADATSCQAADGCNWCLFTQSCAPTGAVAAVCLDASVRSTQYVTGVYTGATVRTMFNMTDLAVGDNITFSFPFFNQPVSTLALTANSVLTAFSSTQGCNPSTNYCRNANYTFAIVPYQGGYDYSFQGTTQYTVWSATSGQQMCTSALGCNVLVLSISYIYQVYQLPVWGKVYAYIYDSGDIEFYYPRSYQYSAYPPPVVGIFRKGADDPLSIQVPIELLSQGALVRFSYQAGATECGAGFANPACTICSANYYGKSCTACACHNGGTCDDGISGTGNCVCAAGYGGINCTDVCKSTTFTCSRCSAQGGYCECDTSECTCRDGWHGSTCSKNMDSCLPLTFDGCQSCVANDACNYCFDGSCFSPLLAGTAAGYACSHSMNASVPYTCAMVDSTQFTIARIDIAVVVLLTLLLALLILCAVFSMVSLRRRTLLYDRHVLTATGGAPDFRFTRRQREVVHANFIPPEDVAEGRFVLGIPLRQIQLDRLYQSQHRSLHSKTE